MDQNKHDFRDEVSSEDDFEALLNQSSVEPVHFNPGDRVEGVIIEITDEWVFIDIGGKSEGYIAKEEFLDEEQNLTIKEGDVIHAHFLSSRNGDMLFATRLTSETKGHGHLEEAYHNQIPVEGLVQKEIKGGFQVKIAGDIHAFCPYSQIGLKRVENADPYMGRRLDFRIVEYGDKGRKIILSHRAILEEEREKQKDALRESLEEGMTVSGEVTSVRDFGAFVDIGGMEGLIPISEISWGRVEDIRGVISVGQKVDVVIKKLDWEKDKFSFSLKEVSPDPWDSMDLKYREGSRHTGKVSRLAPFGAFVTLEPGIDGLVHISELGKEKRIRHPREVLKENQTLEVKVARVDPREKRLSLTVLSEEQDAETIDLYKKHVASSRKNSSGSLGTLGDMLRTKLR